MKLIIQKWGDSKAIILPANVCKIYDLKFKDIIDIAIRQTEVRPIDIIKSRGSDLKCKDLLEAMEKNEKNKTK